MSLYLSLVSLHVVTVIFGLGPLSALTIGATWTSSSPLPFDRIVQLLRIAGWSLLGVLVTGCGVIALTHGALGETRWMKVSFGLFLLLGFLHGQARRLLRRAQKTTPSILPIDPLRRILWAMCAVIVAITYLMEAKPW